MSGPIVLLALSMAVLVIIVLAFRVRRLRNILVLRDALPVPLRTPFTALSSSSGNKSTASERMFSIDEALLRSILLTTRDGLWEWQIDTEYMGFNARYLTMLGYDEKAFPQRFSTWVELLHPEDRTGVVDKQHRLLQETRQNDCFEHVFRMRAVDCTYRWILGRVTVAERAADGMASRVVGTNIDITEIKEARAELKKREQRLEYALSATRDGIWDWNLATDSVYYSPRFLGMLGYESGKLEPKFAAWCELLHPEDRDQVLQHQKIILDCADHGDNVENTYRCRAADGNYLWVLGRGLVVCRDEQGKAQRLVGVQTDVTELRHSLESLRFLVQHDKLTGLYSRSFFDSELIRVQSGHEDPVSLISCDVDGLKLINDNLGHVEGDKLLVLAAEFLKKAVRRSDTVARLGGDEMVLLLCHCPYEAALTIKKNLCDTIAIHNSNPDNLPVHISCGVATRTHCGATCASLVDEADRAMREDKRLRRPQFQAAIKAWLQNRLNRPVETDFDNRL